MPKMTPKRSHIDKILDLWDKWTAQKHTKTANINVKKTGQFTTLCKGDDRSRYIRTTKTADITKYDITSQHSDLVGDVLHK